MLGGAVLLPAHRYSLSRPSFFQRRELTLADKIRIGIVGASVSPLGSLWGARAHIPALKALPDYEVKAVCTAHEDTAKASAEAFGAEFAYHDINDMVKNPDIDLIVVVVRVPSHYAVVMPA